MGTHMESFWGKQSAAFGKEGFSTRTLEFLCSSGIPLVLFQGMYDSNCALENFLALDGPHCEIPRHHLFAHFVGAEFSSPPANLEGFPSMVLDYRQQSSASTNVKTPDSRLPSAQRIIQSQ